MTVCHFKAVAMILVPYMISVKPGFWVGRQTLRRNAHDTGRLAAAAQNGVCLHIGCS
jgi:hypothetical protein